MNVRFRRKVGYPVAREMHLAVPSCAPAGTGAVWLNREYFWNLYAGRVLIGQVTRWDSAGQGWRGFLLDNGQVTDRVGWFATAEEARVNVEARALGRHRAVA
jgi:hypothetical protein